jgi:hypothetical protein
VAGDFTGDGRTDLAVVANDGFGVNPSVIVSVLLGNGDGTFQNPVTYAVGSYTDALVAGDFNGDGRTDLAVANGASNTISVLLSNGDGTFTAPGPSATTPQATPVLADLTGDGISDVFVVDGHGAILWRRGRPQAPGTFDPPITINPGNPSRDIVAVETSQGPVLASVDATDTAVTLYAARGDRFVSVGSLPTGLLPAQIVSGDLNGDGLNDLVVRNAGDGTLSLFLNVASRSALGSGPYSPLLSSATLRIGPGISDVSLANVSGDGRLDIVVTDKLTGEVGVLRNLGNGKFGPVEFYRAGGGLYGVTNSGDSATLTTLEATAGVAAGTFTTRGPMDLLAIDPGSNTFSLLRGLGAGRFANPMTLPSASPAFAVQVADLEGKGIPDAILLSAHQVTVYRGDGKGGFLPNPFTIDAGLEPTGLTVADVNNDGKADLLVGNAYGDLLVLLGNGDGTFQPYHNTGRDVALAVLPNGSPTPDFIYADQGLDRVVVDYGGGQTNVLGDHASGLLAPDALKLADLNGDGIPDLIVANSGSNNVLVYPGLGNGQFGPELNGGHGFFSGTDPVGITVANLNGRPDLVIANKGSNDVSILLNEPTASGGFTFVPGPRLQGGAGPTSTVVQDVNGDGIPDLLVTDGNSNQVTLLPGVGNGFFNDQNPRTFPVGSDPSQIMFGTFLPNQGPEILTVNRGSNDVTVISDFLSSTPVFDTFPTGGVEPVAAFGFEAAGQSLESLVVANGGDGRFTLLGGSEGLELEQTLSNPELPAPSALALAALSGHEVSFYATTAGMEAAFTLAFILPGFTPSAGPVPGSASALAQAPGQLVALSETSLALVGTLLITVAGTSSPSAASFLVASGNQAEANTASGFVSIAPSQGQSLFTQVETEESGGGEPQETMPEVPQDQGQAQGPARGQGAVAPPWVRSLLGLDRLFDEIREEHQEGLPGKDEDAPAIEEETPSSPAPQPAEPVRSRDEDDGMSAEAVDAAIDALGWILLGEGESRRAGTRAVFARGWGSDGASSSRRIGQNQPREPVALGMLLVTTTMVIVRANPAAGPGAKPGDRRPPGRSRPSPVGARL